jgi:predicted RNA-binding Zn-ribbon protein involved in translation (DUF1610 family)
MGELDSVPTRTLVDVALRRAPRCPDHGIPMIDLKAVWWACPVCGKTIDYDDYENRFPVGE